MLFCAALSCGCNLLYALAASVEVAERGWYANHAGFLPELPLVLVVGSRWLLGFGASVLGVGRAYVAAQTSAKVRAERQETRAQKRASDDGRSVPGRRQNPPSP